MSASNFSSVKLPADLVQLACDAAQAPGGCAAFLGEDAYKRLKLRFNKPPPQIPNNHVRVVHPLALARSISNSQARHFGMAAFPG